MHFCFANHASMYMEMHAIHAYLSGQHAQDILSKLLHKQGWAVHVSMNLGVHVTPQDTQAQHIAVLSPLINQVQTNFHLNLHSVFETDEGSQQTMAWIFAYAKALSIQRQPAIQHVENCTLMMRVHHAKALAHTWQAGMTCTVSCPYCHALTFSAECLLFVPVVVCQLP